MPQNNLRNIALFLTASGILLAPVLLMIAGTAYLNQMLAVNCILAAFLSSLLIQSAHMRAISGLVLFGIAMTLLMPAMPFMYIFAGAAVGGLLTWCVPLLPKMA
ncbi:MAG: hypothetical protein Q4A84_06410 [Neisseria sp.]|uniref:hypothetical protein n=1 Tax=Neisseria sp. TaxID=192066 RepID=UPI0026DC3076|nr:hypothetical protein [Neisseria sp.]MDO4641318.1 hypothetical protein [Neisseria sp.]